jgi:hypothetical protein
MASPIPLFDPQAAGAPRILQLYQELELFSSGEPPANSLFVLGRVAGVSPERGTLWQDQLLIVDPPADVTDRFRLEGDVATLFTGEPVATGLPVVQTMPGGVAHLRVGEHFLDVYVQRNGVVVHLPAVGVTLAGAFGSDTLPPRIAYGSDGSDELETLRLLARLVKAPNAQLYVPRQGMLCTDRLAAMERLAADVGYLHTLRRVLPELARRGEPPARVDEAAAALLPAPWRSDAGLTRHAANVQLLMETRR